MALVVRARAPAPPRPDGWGGYLQLSTAAWQPVEHAIAPDRESLSVVRAGPQAEPETIRLICTVSLTPGAMAAADSGEQRVRIGHRPGVLTVPPGPPTVRWAYARAGTAELSCPPRRSDQAVDRTRPPSTEELLALATDVGFGPEPTRLPYRLTPPPTPFAARELTISTESTREVSVSYAGTSAFWADARLTVRMDHRASTAIGPTGDTRLETGVSATTIGGRAAYVRADANGPGLPEICVTAVSGRLCVAASWAGTDENRNQVTDDLAAVTAETAARLQFAADLNDRGTWFDAAATLG